MRFELFGIVWERLATREAGQHNAICMYGLQVSIGIIASWECFGTFWKRLGMLGSVLAALCRQLGTFRSVLERFETVWNI